MDDLSQEQLKELFYYKDGLLYRKSNYKPLIITKETNNYHRYQIAGKRYRVHRMIWILHYGSIPKDYIIDHINQIKIDNRIENLRLVTNSENQMNRSKQKNNKSGYKGVYLDRGRYRSLIQYHGNRIHIGYYDNKEDAARAYDNKAKELHGEFASLNFS
jgi:hypothetical protein